MPVFFHEHCTLGPLPYRLMLNAPRIVTRVTLRDCAGDTGVVSPRVACPLHGRTLGCFPYHVCSHTHYLAYPFRPPRCFSCLAMLSVPPPGRPASTGPVACPLRLHRSQRLTGSPSQVHRLAAPPPQVTPPGRPASTGPAA